jgi:hypothetical protein
MPQTRSFQHSEQSEIFRRDFRRAPLTAKALCPVLAQELRNQIHSSMDVIHGLRKRSLVKFVINQLSKLKPG